eukprot:6177306-Prymnesium_polylepis.1
MICSNAPGGFSFAAWRPMYAFGGIRPPTQAATRRAGTSASSSGSPTSRTCKRPSSSGTRLDAGTTR